jgi:hypothetical protein
MKLYKITDWRSFYETHETGKLKSLKWVPVPNRHDGLTFRQIGTEKNCSDLFAAWVLMIQVASKTERDRRGQLFRNGRPLDAASLALMTGFPARIFSAALDYFSQPSVGWLIAEEWDNELPLSPGNLPDAAGNLPGPPEKIPLNGREGMEGNGKEQKGTEEAPGEPVALALPFASPEFAAAWSDFVKHRTEIKKKLTPTATKQLFANCTKWGEQAAIESIRKSIANGWQGIFEPDAPSNRHRLSNGGRSEFAGRF